jgi:hypothetical protein
VNKIRMNKKGVIGQTISSIPVMLVIFLVMGIFVAGSILMKNIKKPENDMPSSYFNLELNKGDFLYKTIQIPLKGANERYMIIDTLYLVNGEQKNNADFNYDFFYGLANLLKNNGECLIIYSDTINAVAGRSGMAFRKDSSCNEKSPQGILSRKKLGPINICELNENDLKKSYIENNLIANETLFINKQNIVFHYYLGKCLEGTA